MDPRGGRLRADTRVGEVEILLAAQALPVQSPRPPPMPPHLPSRYLIGRELGRGGMGVVYEADDERLGRKVAVKVLHPGPESADRRRRFAQEARAASALNHHNIITVHDIDTHEDVDFIVME